MVLAGRGAVSVPSGKVVGRARLPRAPGRAPSPPAEELAGGLLGPRPRRPRVTASGQEAAGAAPWLLLLFPFGRRSGQRTVSTRPHTLAGRLEASHLAACPQDPPPPGKDRAQRHQGVGPGLAQGAARKPELLVKGALCLPPHRSLPARVGPEAAASSSSGCRVGAQRAEAGEGARGRTGGSLVSKWEEPRASPRGPPAASVGSAGSAAAQKHTDTHKAPATPFSFP